MRTRAVILATVTGFAVMAAALHARADDDDRGGGLGGAFRSGRRATQPRRRSIMGRHGATTGSLPRVATTRGRPIGRVAVTAMMKTTTTKWARNIPSSHREPAIIAA